MLRRVNAALFEAPEGARIQIVAEAQGNNGVNDARFEYATQILPRETILGLPGCTFVVGSASELLEAVVVFDGSAPGTARYDLFEVENGVKSSLQKSTLHSQSAPQISFAIDPLPVDLAVPADFGVVVAAAPTAAARRTAAPTPRKRAAAKKTASSKPKTRAGSSRKGSGKKKVAPRKKAARAKQRAAKKTSRMRAK